MKSRPNPFPIHDVIIDKFHKVPETEARKQLLKSLSDHRDTTTINKLHLMSRLLHKFGGETALLMSNYLPPKQCDIIHALPQLSLPHQELETFSNFLINSKKIAVNNKFEVYTQLARGCGKRNDPHGEIHFYQLALALPLALQKADHQKRHGILVILATRYSEHRVDPLENKVFTYLKEALDIEKKGKVSDIYIRVGGVITEFLKTFKNGVQPQQINKSVLDQLNIILQLVPNDQRVIKAVTDYVDAGVKQLHQSINKTQLQALLDLALILPQLKDRIPALLQLVLKAPKEAYPLASKASCFCAFKHYDKALELAGEALQDNPTDPEALTALGISLHELKRFSASISPFLSLLKLDNLSVSQRQFACAHLSTAYLDVGNAALSIEYAAKAISLNADDVTSTINLILAHFQLGETKQAKKLLADAIKRFPSSSKRLDECQAQLFPQRVSADLDEKASSNTILSQIYYHIKHQEYKLAQHKASFLLNRETEKSLPHLALAAIYDAQHDWDKCLEHLLAARTNIDPLAIACRLMRVYNNLRQYALAEEQAWLILNNRENTSKLGQMERATALSTLLLIYNNDPHDSRGIEKLTQALNLNGLHALEKQHLYYNLAVLHYSNSAFDEAITCCKQAIEMSPLQIPEDIYYLLGHSLYLNNKMQEAIEPLHKFLKTNPHDVYAHLVIGYAYYFDQPSSLVKAMDHFSQALAIDPSSIIELTAVLPEDILKKLQSQDDLPSEAKDSIQFTHSIEEKNQSNPPSPVMGSTSSITSSLSSLSLVESKKNEFSFSTPQRLHRQLQADKKRRKCEAERGADLDNYSEEKEGEGWHIPGVGFLSMKHPKVHKISFSRRDLDKSHLHGYLHRDALLQKKCLPELLDKWEELLEKGTIVAKKGDGIRMMDATESTKITRHLNQGTIPQDLDKAKVTQDLGKAYGAKLKLVGMWGDIRAYGRMISSGDNKVFCFDAVINKSHSVKK